MYEIIAGDPLHERRNAPVVSEKCPTTRSN
jgi:hypothetical protein